METIIYTIVAEIRTKDISGNLIDIEKVKKAMTKAVSNIWDCAGILKINPEIADLKGKLSRRNKQITDLRGQINKLKKGRITCQECGNVLVTGDDGFYCDNQKCEKYDEIILAYES